VWQQVVTGVAAVVAGVAVVVVGVAGVAVVLAFVPVLPSSQVFLLPGSFPSTPSSPHSLIPFF
jgi:hypothetical protein